MKKKNIPQKEKSQKIKKNEMKKKKTFQTRLQDCNDEDLNLDELFYIEGGEETEPAKSCGLGCYINGVDTTNQTHDIEHE